METRLTLITVRSAFVSNMIHMKMNYSMLWMSCIKQILLWSHKTLYTSTFECVVGLNLVESTFDSDVERWGTDDIDILYSIPFTINIHWL